LVGEIYRYGKILIEKNEIQPGFEFRLQDLGSNNRYVVITEKEAEKALGNNFIKFLRRNPNMTPCRDKISNLVRAIHEDMIMKEGVKK